MSKKSAFGAQGSHYEKKEDKRLNREDEGEACSVRVGLEIAV